MGIAMASSIKNKRLRSAIILGIGVVLFPNAFSFCVAMILFAMYNIKLSLFAFFSFDLTIICIMAASLWYLDRSNKIT